MATITFRRLKKNLKKYFFYQKFKRERSKHNANTKKVENKFLFILSPPFCGSTLLSEIVSSSQSVSVNNLFGVREGLKLPEIEAYLKSKNFNLWDEKIKLNWAFIKNVWMKYWELDHPVLLEKSPPSIFRALDITKVFDPAYFIIFYRNPYAHCESLIWRRKLDPEKAAIFTIRCLKIQKENIKNLNNTLILSYEDLTDETDLSLKKTIEFLPDLTNLSIKAKFKAHNYKKENLGITNLNHEKINRLSDAQLSLINKVFSENIELLNFFDYKLIEIN